MRINDIEIKKALVEMEVANKKYALTLYDRIIEVVRKFNGKLLNKRLETALKAIDNNLSIDTRYGDSIYITLYCKNQMIRANDGCHYIKHREITMSSYATTYITTNYKDEQYCVVTLDEKWNKRLDAEAFIDKLMQQRKNIENEIAAIEEKHSKVEEYERTLEALKKQIDDTCKEIPYMLQEYYNLRYTVKREYN